MSPDDAALSHLLRSIRTIAVVGLSPNPARPSHRVAAYLQQAGYRIVPVRPATSQVLGETCYPSLEAIPRELGVELVDVFRRSEETPAVAAAAVAVGANSLWLQSGILHPESRRIATEAGLAYVEDRCLMVEHRRLFG